jgi:hypothetical protein
MNRFCKLSLLGLCLIGLNGCDSVSETDIEKSSVTANKPIVVESYPSKKNRVHRALSDPANSAPSWDFDKDGNADALTDGLLMLRYAFGLRGDSLTTGVVSTSSPLSPAEVEAELVTSVDIADIDDNGQVDALTDGLLLLRYLFGLTDDTLISGVLGTDANRLTAEQITEYLDGQMPGVDTGEDNNSDDDSDDGNTSDGDSGGDDTTDSDSDNQPEIVLINEASSSNATFEDDDGDSPDWFELYNPLSTSVDLTGWSITDDILEPTKWVFPEMYIAAGEYLRLWASDKDKSTAGLYKTLVNQGDNFHYLIPQSSPSNTWNSLNFNDSNWQQGISGFGYGDGDDATQIPAGTTVVYLRKRFTINDLELMDNLWLDIDYDDGFVAYINGVEIARANMPTGPINFNTRPITDREARIYQSGSPVRFPVTDFQSLLSNGDNVLSIQLHNVSNSSSDLSLIPYLSAFYLGSTEDGVSPPSILAFEDPSLHTNFKLSSKGDSLTLFDTDGNQIDHLEIPALPNDKSIGRSLADQSVAYFESPTPGAENVGDGYNGIVQSELTFSHDGGEFSGQSISLSGAGENEEIRYTLDATVPSSQSSLYSSPIIIDDNTVVRARIFKTNHIPSRTESRTYITANTHSLPIVTLVSEPDNFFDQQTGIYVYGPQENYQNRLPFFGANFWQDWERDVHFSFYEPTGELGVAIDAGIKIFGAWSRANDQRSFSIFARSRYGFSNLEYPLFPELDYDKFEAIVLRNSGNDWMQTNIKDAVATSLMDGSGLETQAYRPAIVYLNGEYWGYYNIREKVNEHFLDDKIDVKKSAINLLTNNGEVVQGINDSYNQIIDFITNNSLTNQSNYDYIASQIDIDNIITYLVAQIYLDNTDWPGNNVKFWNSPDTKWRWILYDTDFAFNRFWEASTAHFNDTLSFALDPSGPDWPNPPWSTLLFRKLMENSEFRDQLINQFADELNGRFKAENVVQHIDSIADYVAPEIAMHFAHWSNWERRSDYWKAQPMLSTFSEWQSKVDIMKTFANNRIPLLVDHYLNYFGLSGMYTLTLTIDNTAAGAVKLNSLQLSEASWQGEYFNNVPVSLTAVPNEGYEFSHWQGSVYSTQDTLELSRSSNTSIKAVFRASGN